MQLLSEHSRVGPLSGEAGGSQGQVPGGFHEDTLLPWQVLFTLSLSSLR